MSPHYFVTNTIAKPLFLSPLHRLASLCSGLFASRGTDPKYSADRVTAAVNLQQMANAMDSRQPSLAAELRAFAARS